MKEQNRLSLEWTGVVQRVRYELAALDGDMRQWLARRVREVERLQNELDLLFRKVGGPSTCASCLGDCCSRGKHHFTLTNLLSFMFSNEAVPAPDFSKSCPFLGGSGCILPISGRPYNCVTFFCERLDAELTSEDRILYTELDSQLRKEYLAVAARLPSASLRGLWIATEKIGEGRILRFDQNKC